VDGTKREYVLKLPDGYDATKPHRLVFTFHGAAFTAQNIADGKASSSDGRVLVDKPFWIGPLADKDVIFIAPQGISGWPNDGGRDVKFVKALLALFKSQLCLDETRLFAMGFSFGGIMTIRTGCELAAEFRAIAPMSGSLYDGGATTEATAKSCPGPEHPIAYWSSHGTDDATISPKNGKAARDVFVKWNHCKPDTMPATPDGCVKYNGCDAGYPVTWCDFKGVHEPAPFAPEEIWKFFAQF
jgi:poly(3-hydroxybutyrate) depolymerase